MKDCDHCGKCCSGSPCGLAERFGYYTKPGMPCAALRRMEGKMLCGLVLEAPTAEERHEIENAIKVGWGCHLWPQEVPDGV
jgi:hypothetical protein